MVHGDRVENVESGNTMTREIREDVRNISGTCNWARQAGSFSMPSRLANDCSVG